MGMGCSPHSQKLANIRCWLSKERLTVARISFVMSAPLGYVSMKQKLLGLSQRYVAALRKHLKPDRRAISPNGAALSLGREAMALGLETLELTLMHERALASLAVPESKRGLIKRAEVFFTKANTPIEETHRAARQTKVHLSRLKETLGQRTLELAATNRQLQRGVARRKAMEDEFAKSGKHHQKCLKESLQLQKRLRQLTHRVLAAQEADRQKISRELHDEIARPYWASMS